MQKITPFIWFDNNAEDAVNFYTSIFKNSKTGKITRYDEDSAKASGQKQGSVMTISFKIYGQEFTAINGGPHFKINPSISFFVILEKDNDVIKLWEKLSEGGMVLMELQKYDWSEKYGWLQDKFGVFWQIGLGKKKDVGQNITPCLLFAGTHHGRAEEAVNFYISVFKDSDIAGILHYEEGEEEPQGTVKHAQFTIEDEVFMAMDSSREQPLEFNEAISFVVNCKNQEEIDYYWEKLTSEGEEGPCGWLKDKFGVSWQIVPIALGEMLGEQDPVKSKRVMKALLQMKKLHLKTLEESYSGEKIPF